MDLGLSHESVLESQKGVSRRSMYVLHLLLQTQPNPTHRAGLSLKLEPSLFLGNLTQPKPMDWVLFLEIFKPNLFLGNLVNL